MKKILSLTITALMIHIGAVFAQKVIVKADEERIDNTPRSGLSTVIILEKDEVEKAWIKQLKEFGKVESKNGNYIVDKVIIPSISTTPVKLFSTTIASKEGTKVFLAVDLGKEYVSTDTKTEYNATEKILKNFGVKLYRDDINDQIEAAEKAQTNSARNQERKYKEGQALLTNKEKNKQQKLDLFDQIKKNTSDSIMIHQQIEQNILDQKAAEEDLNKMKSAIERIRAKLNTIE